MEKEDKKEKTKNQNYSAMTLNEILESDDIDEIKLALQDYILTPSEKHFWQNIYPEYSKINQIYEQALPLRSTKTIQFENNLSSNNLNKNNSITKFTVPKFAEQIDDIVQMIVNSLLGKNGKYWNSEKLTSEENEKKLVEIFNRLLQVQLYNFNNIRLVETLRIRDAVLFGIGWKKESWKKKTAKVKKITTEKTEQKLNEDGTFFMNEEGKEVFEYDEKVNIVSEVVEDNLCVEYIPFRNMRMFYCDTDIMNLFEIHEHRYVSLDDCLEIYSNFEQHKDKYIKFISDGGREMTLSDYEDEKKRGNKTSSDIHRKNSNPHLVEMYIDNTYHFTLLVEGDDENIKIIDILIPKKFENRADKFLIKNNHSKPCYTPFIYSPRSDSAYADGKGCRLVGQQILGDIFINLVVAGATKKIFTPVIYNPEYVDQTTVSNSILGKTYEILLTKNAGLEAIDKVFQQQKFDFNVPEFFNLSNYFYSKNEELSKISNPQSAPADNAFIKTFSGIQTQINKLQSNINFSISLNSYFEQQFLFRCFLNILQYLPRQFAIDITEKDKTEWIIIQNSYNNQIRNVNDLLTIDNDEIIEEYQKNRKKQGKKEVYLIDELLKLNIQLLQIDFGAIADEIRLNELINALSIVNPLFQSGMVGKDEISVIINEIMRLLNTNIKVKSNTSELEKIQDENRRFQIAFDKFYNKIKSGVISQEVFAMIMEQAIPRVNEDDVDEMHLKYNLPALLETKHGQEHLQRYQEKQAAQQQIEQLAGQNNLSQQIPNMNKINPNQIMNNVSTAGGQQ